MARRFNFIKRWAIKTGLALIKGEVNKIKYVPLLDLVTGKIDLLDEIGEVLTDKNTDDKAQLKEVFDNYKEDLVDSTLETAARIIEKEMKNKFQAEILAAAIRAAAAEQAFPDDEEEETIVDVIS